MNTAVSVDFDTQQKAYQKYRFILKGIRKSDGGNGRTGNRKQTTREQVSEQFGLPISTVKQIVRIHDELNGIEHTHPEQYLEQRAFIEEAERIEAVNAGNTVCPRCNNEPTEAGDEVRVRVNPYEVVIYGKLKPMYSCFMCYLDVSYGI